MMPADYRSDDVIFRLDGQAMPGHMVERHAVNRDELPEPERDILSADKEIYTVLLLRDGRWAGLYEQIDNAPGPLFDRHKTTGKASADLAEVLEIFPAHDFGRYFREDVLFIAQRRED